MKYITYVNEYKQEIIEFWEYSEGVIADHYEVFESIKKDNELNILEPISAGFIGYAKNGKLICYGESTTLQLKSQPEKDTNMLIEYIRKLKEGLNPELDEQEEYETLDFLNFFGNGRF